MTMSSVVIDKEKLVDLILESLEATENGYWETESIPIGRISGMLITVEITKEDREFDESSQYICVTSEAV